MSRFPIFSILTAILILLFLSGSDAFQLNILNTQKNLLNLNLHSNVLSKIVGLLSEDFSLKSTFKNVDPKLLKIFTDSPDANPGLLVDFGGNGDVLDVIKASSLSFPTTQKQREALAAGLKEHASQKQHLTKQVLGILGVKFQSFWIGNQMVIPSGGSLKLVQILSACPGVSWVSEMPKVKIGPVSKGQTININPDEDNPLGWNIKKIGADMAWGHCPANGTGIIVMNIDTGVKPTHEAISDRFLKMWFDPTNLTATDLTDEHGHGTHTMCTMAGSKKSGVGVAPKACWIACKGCTTDSCPSLALYLCGQIVIELCASGSHFCPHIISNSWGSLPLIGSNVWYNDVVNAWTCAGILHVFACGNTGPACASCGAPGNNPKIFCTGSTNINDSLSVFSSKGPGFQITGRKPLVDGDSNEEAPGHGIFIDLKPNVAAPGEKILSCGIASNTSYVNMSGTSMATPCVAGTMALILSHLCDKMKLNDTEKIDGTQCRRCDIPGNNFPFKLVFQEAIEAILETTANRVEMTVPFVLTSSFPFINFKCLEFGLNKIQNKWPNYQFGWGRIQAFQACNKTFTCDK